MSDSEPENSPEAGPSRPRRSNGHTQSLSQKRKRITDVNEIFAKPDLEEQLRLSKGYRALQNEAEESRANLANLTPAELVKAVGKQGELFVNVRDTGIGALDANLMRTNTETAMALAKKFKIDGIAFDIDDFLIKVKGRLGLDRIQLEDQEPASEDELDDEDAEDARRGGRGGGRARKGVLGDWEKIGWMAAKYSRRITGVEFMYGPLGQEHKKRKVAARQKKRALAPEVRPEEVQTQKGENKSKDDFASHIRLVKKVLDKLDPTSQGINFFELVINPDDYGQTVENCFFVSFLLRQGMAGMKVAEDGMIMINSAEDHDEELEGQVTMNQAVVELDMETWQEAIKVFGISRSAIPHRDYSKIREMTANGWYS